LQPGTSLSVEKGRCRLVKVGIPTEIKNNEFRVAITPAGVFELSPSRTRGLRAGGRRRRLVDLRRRLRGAGATILPAPTTCGRPAT
jgi:alanine dehydrogenase